MINPGRPVKPSQIFVGKIRSLPKSGAPQRCHLLIVIISELRPKMFYMIGPRMGAAIKSVMEPLCG